MIHAVPVILWYAMMLAVACALASVAAFGERRNRDLLWRLVFWLVIVIAINVREIAAKL